MLLLTGAALLSVARLNPARRVESEAHRSATASGATARESVPPAERAA